MKYSKIAFFFLVITLPIFSQSWEEIKFKNIIKQSQDYSCGAASLATILTYYYNDSKSEKDILEIIAKINNYNLKIKDKKYKYTMLDLKKVANQYGYEAIGISLSYTDLKKLKIPAIVFLKRNNKKHFSIYKGKKNNLIYLADPTWGNVKWAEEKFKNRFLSFSVNNEKVGRILLITKKNKEINPDFFME